MVRLGMKQNFEIFFRNNFGNEIAEKEKFLEIRHKGTKVNC